MTDFTRKAIRFAYNGINLNAAVDNMPEGRCPVCENWRQEQDGSLSVRPGLGAGSNAQIGAQSNLHSARRLDDTSTGSTVSTLLCGAGTHIGTINTDLTGATDRDSGYSGDPLSMVVHRPTQSLKKYLYVADRSRTRKFDQTGSHKAIGLAQPRTPPTATLAAPSYKVLDEFNDHTLWTSGGTVTAKSNNTRVDGATRTATKILYESGSTGWATVRPSSMADIGRGMRLTFNPASTNETATVEEVYKGSAASAFVVLKEGLVAMYAVHPTTPIDVVVGSLVSFSGTGEYAKVLSVHDTPSGPPSFVVSTILQPSGNVQAWASFKVYLVSNHTDASPISAASVEFQMTSGTGYITRTVALDLSLIASGVQTLPDDRLHLSVLVDKPELISEIKLYWDVDSATNDFTRNYMQKILRSNDVTSVTKDTQTQISNRQLRLQRDIIDHSRVLKDDSAIDIGPSSGDLVDDPTTADPVADLPRSDQTDAGQNQYSEVYWRVGEMTTQDIGRIGSDESRGLANVAALKIAVIAKGAITVRIDGWWLGGGFGPDVSETEIPYIYRYRYRDSSTGVVSNWSPPMLGGITPRRQKANLTAFNSGDPEVDQVDWFRFGGVIDGWHFAGSCAHSSLAFVDTYPDADLDVRGSLSGQQAEDYQLWPLHSTPITGTCTAVGPLVAIGGGGTISSAVVPGVRIRIGPDWHIIQRVISGGQFLYVTDSVGSQTAGTAFEIPDPVLSSQVLPVLAGPFFGFFFGLGDKVNPQRLYYANGNQCDSTREDQYLDIESEVLQNVAGGEDWMLVFTSGGIYSVEPSFGLADKGGNLFRYRRIPGSIGLFARWAVCVADTGAAFLGKDGIYYTAGGVPELLTEDLRPIFPHEGSLGVAVNGMQPPNMVAAQKTNMRLSYVDNELIFDYVDTSGGRHSLVRRFKPNSKSFGWRYYTYSTGALIHYDEEGEDVHSTLVGCADGKLYRLGRTSADAGGASITATLQTHSDDMNDPVANKYFGHVVMDYDTDGATIACTTGFDNHSLTPFAATNLNEAAGRRQRRIDFDSGQGRQSRNISLALSTTVTTQRPVLHLWQPAFSGRPDASLLRGRDFKPLPTCVFARGIYITADTQGVSRSALLEYVQDDGSVASVTITGIDHDVMTTRYYPIAGGIYLYAYRLRPTDVGSWELADDGNLDSEPAPPLSDSPTQWFDLGGLRFVQGVTFDIDTRNAATDMAVKVDGDVLQTTIQSGANSGPVQANGRSQLAYSFDVPFLTHLIRFDPSGPVRLWSAKPEARPDVELAYMWKSQQTACGFPGFKFFGDGYISVRSTENFRFFIIADGVPYEVTFYDAVRNTANARRRFRFRCPTFKAKSAEFQAYTQTAAGRVAIYENDFTLEVRPWGYEGGWQIITPLGGTHHDRGATI